LINLPAKPGGFKRSMGNSLTKQIQHRNDLHPWKQTLPASIAPTRTGPPPTRVSLRTSQGLEEPSVRYTWPGASELRRNIASGAPPPDPPPSRQELRSTNANKKMTVQIPLH